jgi:hypothetical protein
MTDQVSVVPVRWLTWPACRVWNASEQPHQLWLTDITEHPTAEGETRPCAIKDACAKRIVGSSVGGRMTSDLAVKAPRNALALLARRRDRALRPRQPDPLPRLRPGPGDAQLRGWMDRGGARADNAAMESSFILVWQHVPNRQRWATRKPLRPAIVVWIERIHHRRRRQDALGPHDPNRVQHTGPGRSCGLPAATDQSQLKSGRVPPGLPRLRRHRTLTMQAAGMAVARGRTRERCPPSPQVEPRKPTLLRPSPWVVLEDRPVLLGRSRPR